MMPRTVFRLQLAETTGKRRHALIRIGISVLLAMPFIFVDMPAQAKAIGVVMVVLFTAFFGSAVAHARLCEQGRFSRLMLLPIPRPLLWFDLILASALGRIVPTVIVLTGFVAFNSSGLTIASLVHITAMLCAAVVLLVLLGTLTGQVARSNGEVHLFGALICAMIAFLSGITPGVDKLHWLTHAQAANPLYRLKTALMDVTNGTIALSTTALVGAWVILIILTLLVLVRWTADSIKNKQLTPTKP
jgi:hypothetical protein